MCRCHFDLLEKNQHVNGTTQSSSHPIGTFHAATQRIHNAIVNEFGDRSISTETSNTGITSSDAIELEDRPEHNDLDDFRILEQEGVSIHLQCLKFRVSFSFSVMFLLCGGFSASRLDTLFPQSRKFKDLFKETRIVSPCKSIVAHLQ